MLLNKKKRLHLARMLSRIDRMGPGEPFPAVEGGRAIGDAFRIGITGPVGAGKSTIINRLAREFRGHDQTIGVIAVDPSSPFTGGAVLGDRIRMVDLALDEGTFIRSLATRGAFGGLAESTIDASDLLDVFGFDRIIIETVGVGQTEVDIVEACDITVVVLEPSSGDSVQAIKAGLMEIADLFVVNKMDLKGARRFVTDLEASIGLRDAAKSTKIIPLQSDSAEGIAELYGWLEDYFIKASANGALLERRKGQRKKRIRRFAEGIIMRRLWEKIDTNILDEAALGDLPVREAAQEIVNKFTTVKVS